MISIENTKYHPKAMTVAKKSKNYKKF